MHPLVGTDQRSARRREAHLSPPGHAVTWNVRGSSLRLTASDRSLIGPCGVALVLLFLLTACGSDDATPAAPTVTATAVQAQAQAPTATGAPAHISTRIPSPAPTRSSGPAPVQGYTVVNRYPHDDTAFTQGLVYVDGAFYEGTGLEGQSELRRVELETGEVLQSVALDAEHFGEGIAVLGGRIYQLTWQSGVCFVYDRATFDVVGQFAYETEGWGLTTDGERLIMSDGSATLFFRDPETFAVLDTVQVHDAGTPVVRLNELEYIDGEVWANVWMTDRIVRIDPATGRVTAWVDLRGLYPASERDGSGQDVLNGIAWDAATGRLFVTGKLWPEVFEITVGD